MAADRAQRRELQKLGEGIEGPLRADPRLSGAETDQRQRRQLIGVDVGVHHAGRVREQREPAAAAAQGRVERARVGIGAGRSVHGSANGSDPVGWGERLARTH